MTSAHCRMPRVYTCQHLQATRKERWRPRAWLEIAVGHAPPRRLAATPEGCPKSLDSKPSGCLVRCQGCHANSSGLQGVCALCRHCQILKLHCMFSLPCWRLIDNWPLGVVPFLQVPKTAENFRRLCTGEHPGSASYGDSSNNSRILYWRRQFDMGILTRTGNCQQVQVS